MIKSVKTKSEEPKERKLTLKEQGFVKDIVRTKNGTEAVVLNYNVKDRKVASVIGSQNLAKLNIKKAIMELFDKQELSVEEVIKTHKRNLLQDKQLGVSQSAVVDYYELCGIKKKDDNSNTTNIAFIVNTQE